MAKYRGSCRSPLRTGAGRSLSLSPGRGVGDLQGGDLTDDDARSPHSPVRSSRDATLQAVLERRRRLISELKVAARGAGDRCDALRQSADDFDDQRRRLEQELTTTKQQLQHAYV